ncbi:MAG: glycerate kinase [Bacteroidota bacterium]
MKVLIAPDKFKGSLSALAVAQAIEKGIKQHDASIDCILHPLADGGDGSVAILSHFLEVQRIDISVDDPLGRSIPCYYYLSDKSAFIELAAASGLVLLKAAERNPLQTSTYGTGQIILDAIQRGATNIFLFLGGSATNDAGMGIAQALGIQFLDKNGKALKPIGANLNHIHTIDHTQLRFPLSAIEFNCLCDVQNPFYGENGASHIYAAQKGADEKAIVVLDRGLQHFAQVIQAQFHIDIQTVAGSGAAGGIAGGLFGLLNAKIKSGIDTILAISRFEEKLKTADVVISGEGKLDTQTLEGKVVSGVAALAKQYQKPLFLFVGQHELSEEQQAVLGIQQVFSVIEQAANVEDAMERAGAILTQLATRKYQVTQKK